MATNGKSLINGNGGPVRNVRAGAECLGFLGAEAASMATSLGVVAVADQLIPKPILKHTYAAVGKVLEPWLLDPFEWAKHKFCRLEECRTDKTKSRQERAEEMAKIILVFGAAWAISMRAKLYTRRGLNKLLDLHEHEVQLPKDTSWARRAMNVVVPWDKMTSQERMIFTADEAVHYGSIALMNMPMAHVTDEMIRSAKNVVKKVSGCSDQKAQEIADMAVIWELPNLLGMMSGWGAIAGKHYLKWPESQPALRKIFSGGSSHAERLEQSTSLSSAPIKS